MKYYIFILIINQLHYAYSAIPNWNLLSQSVDLMENKNSYDYVIYNKEYDGITLKLTKKITKNSNGVTTKNYLEATGKGSKEVAFEDIDSHYANKLGCSILS